MIEDETLAAATSIVRNLAKSSTPAFDASDTKITYANSPLNSYKENITRLPGSDNVTKGAFERELVALQQRIWYLEAKAATVSHNAFPDTPNEPGKPASPFELEGGGSGTNSCVTTLSRQRSRSARKFRIAQFLAARDEDTDGRQISGEDLVHVRDHVQRQADEIQAQKETIAEVSKRLSDQEDQTKRTFSKFEHEDISPLQRELQKHQQANEAFQKALKEIGSIITKVANGDLSHKVLIHKVEMDPEIATFKHTINTMMDQLQVFGSEVSRVAREVGTEGKLGGQAQITGVSGIWKELTENGS